jgi:hypothetical protein
MKTLRNMKKQPKLKQKRKMNSVSHSQCESDASCIHSHKQDEKLASVNGHFLPLTTCSLQIAFDSLSANEMLLFFASHDTYTNNLQTL